MVTLSIIVPVYNGEAFLEACIDSLIAAGGKDCEIVLVNDGSTDGSGMICDKYKVEYDNVKVVHQENSGALLARKKGVENSCGRYLAFVDCDDWIDSDMYAELICDSMAVHVNPDLQRLILKNKGLDKVILISDSFVSNEEPPEDLKHVTDLSFDANRNLCGSRLTMDTVCRNIMTHTNCGIAQAFLMASTNPSVMLGMDDQIGSVEVGKKANLVFVDDMFHIQKVMLNGEFK